MQCLNKHFNVRNVTNRLYSTNLQRSASNTSDKSSTVIRKKFLDYFLNENRHSFVRSSPVVPFCDPTVPFVNAGMNQFKGIFLGTQTPRHRRVANSQKCVRVGGKHNDLTIVGSDGYHHTFFEMLGNWSFGDYFKKEACEMSWKLLTDVYGIDSSCLYVTYFKGDPSLGLDSDYECKEIWREIGVPENRILPFGASENFWEMGLTGPCGPCTEIHIDRNGATNRASQVNRGFEDLTELWNIVFIQYNRLEDGSVKLLPEHHIDTGMGFERLTAVLQNKLSNYDTDIFTPLFNAIRKSSNVVPKYSGNFGSFDVNNLDTNYRILADHARMITACLADGMVPEENPKLRNIMRKSFTISTATFKCEALLKELSYYIADMFHDSYPEMGKNLSHVHQIIDYEQELFNSLRAKSSNEWMKLVKREPKLERLDVIEMPGLIGAYGEIKNAREINGETAFKLFDTHGLDEVTIKQLSGCLGLNFDEHEFRRQLSNAKLRSKRGYVNPDRCKSAMAELTLKNVKPTNDIYKYAYRCSNDGRYIFEDLEVKVLLISCNDQVVDRIEANVSCCLVLDRTNLYCESGGQISDKGSIRFPRGKFEVESVSNVNGYVFHEGRFISNDGESLQRNDSGTLLPDPNVRLNVMRNHTATHLLNAAIKKVSPLATCQKSSQVTPDSLTFDVSIFGDKLSIESLKTVEDLIKSWIDYPNAVTTKVINSQELLQLDDVTLVPGEVYPENGIRIVEMQSETLFSREACCGTHVTNTSHIEDFCIILTHSLGRCTTSIEAVTGERATLAKQYGKEMLETVNVLRRNVDDNIDKPQVLDNTVTNLIKQLNYSIEDANIMPVHVKYQCVEILNVISKKIRESVRQTLKGFVEMEMKNALQTKIKHSKSEQSYIVHYLRSSAIFESVSLQKVTNLCPNMPILVISYADGIVKARCCIPKELVSPTFNAEIWLQSTVATVFKSIAAPPKGQDSKLVCNMKGKKINIIDWDLMLNNAIQSAESFIDDRL